MLRCSFMFLTSFCLSFSAAAIERVRFKETPTNIEFWVLHNEGQRYFAELFERKPGRLQRRLASYAFDQQLAATAFFEARLAGFNKNAISSRSLKKAPTEVENKVIWSADEKWDLSWEDKYHSWILLNTNVDFLANHGVATDCADVGYAYRWIFARINRLPMANHLAGTGDLFTNETMLKEWENLEPAPEWHKDRRFMAALNYLLDNTYTHTLLKELYPILINSKMVNSGAIHLSLFAESGHAQLVRELINDKTLTFPLRTVGSTVPRELRILYENGWLYWEPSVLNESGFFRFLWARKIESAWHIAEPEQMPGYSLEQFGDDFAIGYKNYYQAVISRLVPGWTFEVNVAIKDLTARLIEKLVDRKSVVEKGFAYCQSHDCSPGTSGWESWSTPNRDAAIVGLWQETQNVLIDEECLKDCQDTWNFRLSDYITEVDGRLVTVGSAVQSLYDWSSDPRDPIIDRWTFSN